VIATDTTHGPGCEASTLSLAQRTAYLQPWVDQAQTWLDEGKPEKAEATLRAGMAVVRWDLMVGAA
jgi:hypothetical protein